MNVRPGLVTCVLAGSSALLLACSAVLGIHDIAPPDEAGARQDASTPGDGPAEVGTADGASTSDGGDAGDGAACAVQTPKLPEGGGPACPAEASSCFPQNMTSWMPRWSMPFGPRSGACSAQQIADYYADCRGPNETQSLCTGFGADMQNARCIACMETTVGDGTWGVVIIDAPQTWINVPGCIVLAEPCNLACAEAMTAQTDCYVTACGAACTGSSSQATFQCEQDAVTACTTCSQFLQGAGCFTQITGPTHPAYALCDMSQPGTPAQFTAVATMICGS
jgi:hypothetical protein